MSLWPGVAGAKWETYKRKQALCKYLCNTFGKEVSHINAWGFWDWSVFVILHMALSKARSMANTKGAALTMSISVIPGSESAVRIRT